MPDISTIWNTVRGDWQVSGVVVAAAESTTPLDPHLKFLMHFDGNLKEEVAGRVVSASAGGSISYGAGKFDSSALQWSPKSDPGNPNNSVVYNGTPIIPDQETTGWTLDFWVRVNLEHAGSGASADRFTFLIVNSDFNLFVEQHNSSFPASIACAATASGGIAGLGDPTGGLSHIRICCDPGGPNNGTGKYPVRWFFNGVYIITFALSSSPVGFSHLEVGDCSSAPLQSLGPYSTSGVVEELSIWDKVLSPTNESFTPPTTPWGVQQSSPVSIDWSGASGDLVSGNDLVTAVLISLFTDRVATSDDTVPDATRRLRDPRGWWGDAAVGSRLWLLDRAKRTQETLQRAQNYIVEALQWLLDDGVASAVDVRVEWTRQSTLGAQITVYSPRTGKPLVRIDSQNVFRLPDAQAWGWNDEHGVGQWVELVNGPAASIPPALGSGGGGGGGTGHVCAAYNYFTGMSPSVVDVPFSTPEAAALYGWHSIGFTDPVVMAATQVWTPVLNADGSLDYEEWDHAFKGSIQSDPVGSYPYYIRRVCADFV